MQEYGEAGSDGAGQFDISFISAVDDKGSVLIADNGNDRLQVMSEQGECRVLQLHPQVSKPRSAVLLNNQLYVASSGKPSLYKYV